MNQKTHLPRDLVPSVYSPPADREIDTPDALRVEAASGATARLAAGHQAVQHTFRRALPATADAGSPLSLALLDLDHFGEAMQTYGPEFGETVLEKVAEFLPRCFRSTDLVCRWDQDEFIILLPHTDGTGAVRALEKALQALHAERLLGPAGEPFRLTFSAGVVEVPAGGDFDAVVEEASRFLQVAKLNGRSRICSRGVQIAPLDTRILLIQSDAVTASVIRYRLERMGAEVVHLAGGENIFEGLERALPSLIVLDLNLSDMDGLEALDRLRHTPALRWVPIMALSYLAEDMSRGFDLGVDDFVLKPFSPEELLARVGRLLKNRPTMLRRG